MAISDESLIGVNDFPSETVSDMVDRNRFHIGFKPEPGIAALNLPFHNRMSY